MSDPTAAIRIDLTGDIESAVKQLRADFKELTGRVGGFENEVKQAFKESTKHTNALRDSIKQISFASLVDNVRNVNDAFKGLSAPGLDFQQQIADLSAITGISGTELNTLSEAARKMGKESGLGASQAAEAFKLLASNIDISTIGGVEGLKALQKETITLSQAAGTDMAMAADTMSFALNQFKLPVSEAARVINVLGAGAKYGAAEIPDLAAALKDSGAVAKQAGLSIEDATGAIEILSQRGLKGSEAGNALRNVLLILQTQAIPGVNLKTQGLSGALQSMQKYMGNATYMAKLFGRENINAAQILISGAAGVKEMTDKVTGTSVAYEQAAIRTNTYQHEIELLRAKMNDFKLKIFESTGALVPWTEVLSEGALGLSQMVPLFWGVGTAVKALRTSQLALNAAQYAMPVLGIIAALTALGVTIYALTGGFDELNFAVAEFSNMELEVKKRTLDDKFETEQLLKTVNNFTLGTHARTVALEKLQQKSKEYFGHLTLETAATIKGTTAMKDYSDSIWRVAMAEAAKEKVKEEMKKQMDLEANGVEVEVGHGIWFQEIWNMMKGASLGPGGIAKGAAKNALGRLQETKNQIAQSDKREAFYEDIYRKNTTPTEKEQYGKNYAPFADRYDSGMVPFATPAAAAPMAANLSPAKTFTIGKVESNITINTTNLGQSTAQTQQLITDTIMKGVRDVTNVGK